jgi:acyl-CoA reductase-like NAD-dependent aldehyde dehydrogenase
MLCDALVQDVMHLKSKYLKKSVLELGGNDAFIILEDTGIDKAVEWL